MGRFNRPNVASANLVAILMCVVVLFVLALCTAIFIAAPDGANTGSLITIMIGQLAPTIVGLAALRKANQVGVSTDQIAKYPFEREVRSAMVNILETHLDESVLDNDRPKAGRKPRASGH